MKEKLDTNKITSMLFTCSLVVLLLLAPCKIRHFIQEELGVTKTEVLNKSKTTLTDSSCTSFENNTTTLSSTKPNTLTTNTLNPKTHHSLFAPLLANHINAVFFSPQKKAAQIPLYILYQNLKIYS